MVTSFHVHQPPLFLQPLRLLLKTITLHPPSKSCPWDALTSGSGPSLPIQDWGKGGVPVRQGQPPSFIPRSPSHWRGQFVRGKPWVTMACVAGREEGLVSGRERWARWRGSARCSGAEARAWGGGVGPQCLSNRKPLEGLQVLRSGDCKTWGL